MTADPLPLGALFKIHPHLWQYVHNYEEQEDKPLSEVFSVADNRNARFFITTCKDSWKRYSDLSYYILYLGPCLRDHSYVRFYSDLKYNAFSGDTLSLENRIRRIFDLFSARAKVESEALSKMMGKKSQDSDQKPADGGPKDNPEAEQPDPEALDDLRIAVVASFLKSSREKLALLGSLLNVTPNQTEEIIEFQARLSAAVFSDDRTDRELRRLHKLVQALSKK